MSSSSISQNHNNGTGHIIQSLIVNVLIAISKGIAAFFTGSGAMLAETIHSTADCANQGLLLLGVKQSRRVADASHPFGYGRSAYFWSFMVAMLLFSIGGMFSIYEGVHKFYTPEPIHDVAWAVGVLAFALVLESYATISNIKEINDRRKSETFFEYLRNTKDSDLIVVFGENSAAVLGLFLALIALLASYYTGDTRYDAMGSISIGVVLILVAIFLAIEVKSLLIGESADPEIYIFISSLVAKDPEISELLSCKTIQQGPGEVLVCLKIECLHTLNTKQISNLINDFETGLPPHIKLAYLPNYGMVRLRLSGSGFEKNEIEATIQALFNSLQHLVKDYLVTNEDETMQEVVAKLLLAKSKTISTAESCTGGYIAHLLTEKAGASKYYSGSIVSYSYSAKEDLLQVDKDTLESKGAVSEEVVIQMAKGALDKFHTDFTIAVSGIMGPDGGLPDKPVGTVWIAVGNKGKIITERLNFRFDRSRNIQLTATNALNMVRKFILSEG